MTDTESLQRHLDAAKLIRTWLIQQRDKQDVIPAARAGIRSELSKLNQVIERIEQAQKQAAKAEADEASLLELAKALSFARSTYRTEEVGNADALWAYRTDGQKKSWLEVAKTARDLVAGGVPQQLPPIVFEGNPIQLSRMGHVGRVVIDRDNELAGHVDPDRRVAELGTAAVNALDDWPWKEGHP